MKVTPISRPLRGERIVAVQPEMRPTVEAGWRRRLRFYTGRSLSDKALTTEQVGRAGRLAIRGQMVSPGVVSGLVVGLERAPAVVPRPFEIFDDTAAAADRVTPAADDSVRLPRSFTRYHFHISPGTGIAASGEDVFISKNMRVPVGAVRVYTTTDILTNFERAAGRAASPYEVADAAAAETPVVSESPRGRVLSPRRLGPSLGELLAAGISLPRVGVLVLQPIVLKRVGDYDAGDPCEQDPQNYAYEDWQFVDGCQLVLYTWPAELPESLPGFDSPKWRNLLAYKVFEWETAANDPEMILPWEEVGVPIGLVGFDANYLPMFVDRYSVVRAGGKPKRRRISAPGNSLSARHLTSLLPNAGNPFLWQARLEQFAEQMADVEAEEGSIGKAINQFRFLPPAGLLPRGALELDLGECADRFFPPFFEVTAVPVPLEQLDVAFEQSAPLSPLDTSLPEEVRALVPVPQIYYEPNLLRKEEPDPAFEENIKATEKRLSLWLKRRKNVHAIGKAVNAEILGREAAYPELELRAGEAPADTEIDPSDPELREAEKEYETVLKDGLPAAKAYADLQAEFNKDGSFMQKELLDKSKTPALNRMDESGLKGFIALLEDKVSRANDIVDFGFVRVQTDLYRHRQLMLGSIDASRLATSPALAAIAKGETALATKEEVVNYLHAKRATAPADDPAKAAPGAPGALGEIALSSTTIVSPSSLVGGAGELGADIPFAGAALKSPSNDANKTNLAGAQAASGFMMESLLLPNLLFTPPPPTTKAKESIPVSLAPATLFGAVEKAYVPAAVYQQSAIVGYALDFRNATVAERIKEAPAPEAKNFSVSTKYEILRALEELSEIIVLDDLQFPGFWDYGESDNELQKDDLPTVDEQNKPIVIKVPRQKLKTIQEIKTKKLAAQVLAGRHDQDPANGDEAAFFGAGVRASDKSIAILRIIEGRIQNYRNVIQQCKKALAALEKLVPQINGRLQVIEDSVAEARHDLSVARVLLAEEMARVEAINDRRRKVLAEHVPFLAYQRPRTSDLLAETKARELDPAFVESPVPACLARRATPPLALRSMIEVLRHAPVKWFVNVHPLLDKFDRVEYLQATALSAKVRAGLQFPVMQQMAQATSFFGNLGQAIGQVVGAQKQVVSKYRVQTAELDLSGFVSHSWTLARDRVREAVSLGDLIDPNHGRSDVSRQAADELEKLTQVAACLYSSLGVVLPAVRLEWAERLSQYDAPLDLRSLASLPRWGEIQYLDRREMQTFVDWLFSRIDTGQAEAVSMLNDMVRVCILLASHAPINEIVAGKLAQPAEVREGGSLHLAVDPAKVHVGMHVLMYNGSEVVARGVVEDLSSGQVATKVTQVNSRAKTVSLTSSSQFQIAEAGAFERNPLMTHTGLRKA